MPSGRTLALEALTGSCQSATKGLPGKRSWGTHRTSWAARAAGSLGGHDHDGIRVDARFVGRMPQVSLAR
jgi:hypothetical protein